MKTRDRNGAAWRDGLITIDRTDIDPPGSDAVLRQIGLLDELEHELAKTAEEERVIGASVAALNDLRRELGLEAVRLDPANVHIMTETELWTRWGNSRDAFAGLGHAFVPRRYLFACTAQSLTHELVHLSAYRAVIDPALAGDEAVRLIRSGLSRTVYAGGRLQKMFLGLDEGVTELIAIEVRRRLVERSGLLDERTSRLLLTDHSYPAQVRLATELIKLAAGGREEGSARRLLFADYFAHSSKFLKRLARVRPGASKMLRTMDTGTDTLVVAATLGLDQAAACIRSALAWRPKR